MYNVREKERILTCLWNDCLNAKSHDANEDLLLDIEILSSLLLPSASLFIVVKLLYMVSFLLGPLLYSDSPRSFDLDLKRHYYDEYTLITFVFN